LEGACSRIGRATLRPPSMDSTVGGRIPREPERPPFARKRSPTGRGEADQRRFRTGLRSAGRCWGPDGVRRPGRRGRRSCRWCSCRDRRPRSRAAGAARESGRACRRSAARPG